MDTFFDLNYEYYILLNSRYPIASIVNALDNRKNFMDDNLSLPNLKNQDVTNDFLIVGGGKSMSSQSSK